VLKWLEVRLDVGCDKRLVYEYRIEPLKCDRDALKQECRLASIVCSGTQPPTHLSEKTQRARSYSPPPSFERDWYKKSKLWGRQNNWPPSERRQALRRQQQNDLSFVLLLNVCNCNVSHCMHTWLVIQPACQLSTVLIKNTGRWCKPQDSILTVGVPTVWFRTNKSIHITWSTIP